MDQIHVFSKETDSRKGKGSYAAAPIVCGVD